MDFYIQKATFHCMNCHEVIGRRLKEPPFTFHLLGNFRKERFLLSDGTYTNIYLCAECDHGENYDIAKLDIQLQEDFKQQEKKSKLPGWAKQKHFDHLRGLKIKFKMKARGK